METFGEYLKRQREAKMVSLREIAHLTNITQRHLDSIENDDYDKVPGGPYIRGYISSYAKTIGINADEVLNKFDSLQRERNAAGEEQELSEDTSRRTPVAFSLNKGSRLLLCSAILLSLTFGAYHLFFHSGKKVNVADNLQKLQNKRLAATVLMNSEKNVEQLTLKENSVFSSKPESLPKVVEPENKEKGRDVHSFETRSNLESKDPETSAGLPFSASEQPVKISKQTQPAQKLGTHSKNASQLKTAALATLPRSEHHNSDKALLSEKWNVQRRKIPGAASSEQTEEVQPDYENDVEVLKATVCSNVKDRIPRGENNYFQWSMKKIYIWNLIKCQSHFSSIRHIYYFKEQKVSDIVLDVRSPLWRTWSCKALLDKRFIGPWRVDVTSMDGKLLQRVHFEVS